MRPVISAARLSGDIVKVTGSTSAYTGVAPTCTTAIAVPTKVSAGTTTSSPGPTPWASRASSMAVVPLLTPTQRRTPR